MLLTLRYISKAAKHMLVSQREWCWLIGVHHTSRHSTMPVRGSNTTSAPQYGCIEDFMASPKHGVVDTIHRLDMLTPELLPQVQVLSCV